MKVGSLSVGCGLRTLLAASTVVVASFPGCVAPNAGPYTPQSEAQRDPQESQRLTMRAAELMESDPAQAEKLLREALTKDLYDGPAHNNLGVLYLKQGRLYEAASEFEWSRKLLPGLPDPRMNLALTLERAGRTKEALDTYRTALEVYPGHIQTMQAIARLQVRAGKTDDFTQECLREIAMRGETAQWKEWARGRMAILPAR
jgi:tetratricopeptide (TPR) repeat protein